MYERVGVVSCLEEALEKLGSEGTMKDGSGISKGLGLDMDWNLWNVLQEM